MNILPFDRQIAVVNALIEGCSIRTAERLTKTHRDTVMRLGARVGRGCAALHDLMFRDLQISQLQFDELWAYVGKKQKRVKSGDDPSKGDCYSFLALDSLNKVIVSYRLGKRDGDTTLAFIKDLRKRVVGAPLISSDAFAAYEPAIRAVFGDNCHYGQIAKSYVSEPPINAARRYSPGTVVKSNEELHNRLYARLPYVNIARRASKLDGSHGLAPLHALNERVQQKDGKPQSGCCTVRRAL